MGLERGVTGWVLHTVPVALYAWLRYPTDVRAALEESLRLGGDTDTVGAIIGGLVGAGAGAQALPPEWLAGLREWPRSVRWMRQLAARLAARFPSDGAARPVRPVPVAWPALPLRGLVQLAVVLAHGLRRLLPPY